MRAISIVAAAAALAMNSVHAQPVPTSRDATSRALAAPTSSAVSEEPSAVARPPAPPELAPLSQDFQADMANSQLQTYRYNQLTEQALALKKLCDTGFGPADICPRAGASADNTTAADSAGLPTVEEISGSKSALRAVLAFSDGRHVTVHMGSVLPNGLIVGAVTEDDVRVRRGLGQEAVLYFSGAQSK